MEKPEYLAENQKIKSIRRVSQTGIRLSCFIDIIFHRYNTFRRLNVKKGDMFEAVVETIDFPNKGILHVDGERVIVKNAIPGEGPVCGK